jgi:hypothetical protein
MQLEDHRRRGSMIGIRPCPAHGTRTPMRLALASGGALLLALLTWLLLSGINTNASAYAEAQRAFDDFALAEASIGRDVLRARAGLLGNYDVLAEAEEAMESAASRIRLHRNEPGLFREVGPIPLGHPEPPMASAAR